ncbi:hypothetical protein V8C86DRAFT_2644504 [Haematococcus lacustris]
MSPMTQPTESMGQTASVAPATEHHPTVSSTECKPASNTSPTCGAVLESWVVAPSNNNQWAIFLSFWSCIAGLAIFFLVWAFPRIVDNVFNPAINAIQSNLSPVEIGVVIVAGCCFLPLTIILSEVPFVWVAAVVFNFPVAWACVAAGTAAGMAMAFLLARAFLKPYILRFMNRYRYTQAVLLSIRKAGAFKTVLVLRLSPVPYTIINVVMAVPENVGFVTFMVASVIGKQPELVVVSHAAIEARSLRQAAQTEAARLRGIQHIVCGGRHS